MKKSGAEIMVQLLEKKGITVIAGIPGSANLPLYDVLHDSPIRHILARHEQGAGFIAQGIARSTGKASVCLATSGPGSTNLLTAIADAKSDSVPLVAITGQVPRAFIGTDAFQEIDTYRLTRPITKKSYQVRTALSLLEIIPEAFHLAESGRPGPVVIDVPKDVFTEQCEFDEWPAFIEPAKPVQRSASVTQQIAELINRSSRPIILAGAGIIEAKTESLLKNIAENCQLPVTTTLRGMGCFPPDHPLSLGMVGMHGTRLANQLMDEADLLLAFGVRFDDRATGDVKAFCRHATIVHVDIDPHEINKIKAADYSQVADLNDFFQALYPLLTPTLARQSWVDTIQTILDSLPKQPFSLFEPTSPTALIKAVSSIVPPDSIITTDVGQHQMWVAQAYPFKQPRTFLTSGGLGTMGFGLPAALGAALAFPHKTVVCFTGDGSLLMNIQELATMADINPNVKLILFNNGQLGLVRQQQALFYNQKYMAAHFKTETDFAATARSFGIKAVDLNGTGHWLDQLATALTAPGPVLINVPVNESANVLPMVPPGAANTHMIG